MNVSAKVSNQRYISRITQNTLALVLAGGKGTRLGSLTSHRVKPAVPFGGHFRIIDFPLSNCVNSGIRRIGILTQYKAHSLIQHVHQGWAFLRPELGEFMELLPAQQRTGDEWYLGTADAVYQNMDILRLHDPTYLLVLGGDHIYKMDYGPMLAQHVSSGADVTVGCMPVPISEASSFGIMEVDATNRIQRFTEKPTHCEPMPDQPDYALASMGIYVFNTRYLLSRLLVDSNSATSGHDFGKDIIPAAVADSDVFAFLYLGHDGETSAYWRDVGSIDSYWRANMELIGVNPELNIYDQRWPILTWQRQAPPAKFVLDEPGRCGVATNSMVAGGCIVSGATVRNSVLSSHVTVAEGSTIESAVLLENVRVGRDVHIKRAVIETGCTIPDGMHIGFDAVLDGTRFERSDGGIILVTPEMLGQEVNHVR
ncbi:MULTISPECIES: glucose-1-phosphate adenylyltransferase [Halomonadaceae]|uniref:Glucose-1-phosphate adenylyltransferase n=1 Tax=Vreelandella halophila TaxID=86177 RepID=A0A9X4YDU9_9GAMM|nr:MULTISPECIES: glucose-1-phosphate adenylyltransferase [Halomonas]MYL27834.1 glucose-1-phosphate adenylyltransferase [Halomonas utahensis]MYL74960.1 glucose-1-phosphate adenylyltransferase [Halomonas sp. 22501_18_FS]